MRVNFFTRLRLLPIVFRSSIPGRCASQSSKHPVLSIKALNDYGHYDRAFQLFDHLVKQNNVTIISLLNILETCAKSENLERGRQIERFINQSMRWEDDIRLQTSLINMYMKCQKIEQAQRIFERIRHSPECDVVVYNAMLKGYLRNHQAQRCFECFDQMRGKIPADNVTYILMLNACTELRDMERGKAIHEELKSSLTTQHVHLQNALIDFYGKINQIDTAEKIFDQMILRETSTYNSLMKAYLINQMPIQVLELFEQMKQTDSHSIGPIGFKPDLITFMAVCDACEKLRLLDSPDSTYQHFSWKTIFSDPSSMSEQKS